MNNTQTNTGALIKILLVLLVIIAIVFLVFRKDLSVPSQEVGNTKKEIANVNYACSEGKTINAVLYEGDEVTVAPGDMPIPTGSAKVTLSDGRVLDLNQSISADGVRYANEDESFVFWSKGNTALVFENDEEKSYINCVESEGSSAGAMTETYTDPALRLSVVYPKGYTVEKNYTYEALGPGKEIKGVKFIIPKSFTAGTNLSEDTYMSVENVPLKNGEVCSADLFVDKAITGGAKVDPADDNGVIYSVASGTDAGAGNRYEDTVYARVEDPCIAVRYFIHYGAIGNYPAGSTKEFDRAQLVSAFDQIRTSVMVVSKGE